MIYIIVFNEPPYVEEGIELIEKAIKINKKTCGDGEFTEKCTKFIKDKFKVNNALLTTSCTHALEIAAIVCGIKEGDEVIMPSFTFVSTANAFVLRGAKIVFVDIRPDTMNINENLIEQAITNKTKAIVPVHYAGVSCEMDKIIEISKKYNLYVIEDAAQGVSSKYNGKYLGTMGDIGCYSFHETKNYSMGEGGAILIKEKGLMEKAEIIREKGTDRSRYFRGQVDKYSWQSIGSSYLPSEINVAYLYAQLKIYKEINNNRISTWDLYNIGLQNLKNKGFIELPTIPEKCEHNAHMFYVKVKNLEVRTKLIEFLKNEGILAVFHYVPLHSAYAGEKYGVFNGEDIYTTKESERILRLPIFYNIKESDVTYIISKMEEFFNEGTIIYYERNYKSKVLTQV